MALGKFTTAGLIAAAIMVTVPAQAEDSARIERMQQTIEELTVQLGDALRDKGRLQKEVRMLRDTQAGTCPPVPAAPRCPEGHMGMHETPVMPHAAAVAPVQPAMLKEERMARMEAMEEEYRDYKRFREMKEVEAKNQCDTNELRDVLANAGDETLEPAEFSRWFADNAEHCSREKLREVRKIADGMTFSDDARATVGAVEKLWDEKN